MKQALLSIFSSDPSGRSQSTLSKVAWMLFGFILIIAIFEGAVATFISFTGEGKSANNSLVKYFNYGYSIEAKLNRTVGQKGQEAKSIIRAGWVPTELYLPSDGWKTREKRVVFYGMSFTNRLAKAINQSNPEIGTLTRAGPGAPLSHSYALFKADPNRKNASHIVVGILSSSIPYLQGMTGLGHSFESPAPFSYPKFTMIEGELKTVTPIINGRDDFISSYRAKSEKWKAHMAKISENDSYWDPLLFNKTWMDNSALFRLLRRAWASRKVRRNEATVYSKKDGYKTQNPAMLAIPEILIRMQKASKKAGQQLIVVLLHARGEPGFLNDWLNAKLRTAGITVVSSTDVLSSTDYLNFEEGGHYLPRLDESLASEIVKSMK